MNGSEKWGFVWWATGNNAGRSVREFLRDAGCDDFKVYPEGGWRTHEQGVPKELEGCPVISNARNPYDRAVAMAQTTSRERWRHGNGEMTFEELIENVKEVVSRKSWCDDAFWKQFPLLNVYPDYYIRVESLEEDIKSIDCIMNNVDPEKVEQSFDLNIRTNSYQQSEINRFRPETWKDKDNNRLEYFTNGTKMPEHYEMKIKQLYRPNGMRIWEYFYNQELADFVYENWEDAFTLMGYARDSWKQK